MAVRPWIVPDELWELIAPLLPAHPRRLRYPGRKRLPAHSAEGEHLFRRKPNTGSAQAEHHRSEATRLLLRCLRTVRLQVNSGAPYGVLLRNDSPFSSILTALCRRRSRSASAMLGSATRWCHLATGSWLATIVERTAARSSTTSITSFAACPSTTASPQSSSTRSSTLASFSRAFR